MDTKQSLLAHQRAPGETEGRSAWCGGSPAFRSSAQPLPDQPRTDQTLEVVEKKRLNFSATNVHMCHYAANKLEIQPVVQYIWRVAIIFFEANQFLCLTKSSEELVAAGKPPELYTY